jgi:hypothetical protein
MEDLKSSVKRLVLTFEAQPDSMNSLPGILNIDKSGRQSALIVRDFTPKAIEAAKSLGPTDLTVEDLSLEDIFVAMVGKSEDM